jgi:hypothetical protein
LETKRPEGTREVFGIVPEGFVTADSSLSGPHSGELFLPSFTPAGSKVYFIDLYLQKAESLSWSASIDNNWISLSQETGNLRPEFGKNQVRIWVSIDWEKFPGKKDASGRITFTANGKRILVKVSATNNAIDDSATTVYWESNGYVSIWASNYSHKTGGEKGWKELDGLGYSGKCVYTPYIQPVNIDTNQIVKESPSLSYDFYSTSEVAPTLSIYSLPTHPVNNTFSQRYAVSIDDGPIQIVDFRTFGRSEEWKQNVLRNTAHKQIKVPYLKRGKHTLKIFLIDPGVFLDRITIDFGGLKNAYGLIPETKTSR